MTSFKNTNRTVFLLFIWKLWSSSKCKRMNIVKPAKVCCARWGVGGGFEEGAIDVAGGYRQRQGGRAGGRVAATVCARRSVVNDTATLHQRAKVTPPPPRPARALSRPRPTPSNVSCKFLHFLAPRRHVGSIILVASPASATLCICCAELSSMVDICVPLWKLYYPPEKCY